MNLSRTDLFAHLDAGRDSASAKSPTAAPASPAQPCEKPADPSLTSAGGAGSGPGAATQPGRYTALHRELGAALPRLWAKTRAQPGSRAEHRKKLRALLRWLLEKKGFSVRELAPMRYFDGTDVIDGRVDMLVSDSVASPVLATEADWTLEAASLYKLRAAHEKRYAVLWVVGVPAKTRDQAKEARQFAGRVLGRNCGEWLLIYHLEHGWV